MKKLNILEKLRKWTLIATLPMICMACGSATTGSSSSTSTSSSDTSAFPTSFAVASPTDYVDSTGTSSNLRFMTSGSTTYYAWATGKIDQLLGGASPSLTAFTPALYFTQATDADCFGPNVDFQDHPDDTGTGSGQLPSGDLGIWLENDSSGDACSSAQLKSRMEDMRDGTTASLMVLASLVGALDDTGQSLPDATTTSVDLVDEMNDAMTAASRTDVTFTAATINFDSSDSSYNHNVSFTYDDGTDTHDIVVSMQHTPGSTAGAYTGTLSYRVDDDFTGGNCPSTEVTRNGSIQYNRVDSTDITVEVRHAQFCGHGVDGLTADNLVDPSDKYDATSNVNGWGNNFSIFTAAYNPSSMEGDYAYSWQAGPGDGNARIFNLHADSSTSAIAYFGYGADIQNTDGSIEGFICNWAGPGSDRSLIESAQFQEITIDTSTGLGSASTNNIEYAPTTSCDYDGTGTFVYDSNADGDLSDEDPTVAVTNDLANGQDLNSDGDSTIEEVIDNAGFVTPSL